MAIITVAGRFCGPPGTANGGYLVGRLSSLTTELVRVRLRAPIPLETELQVVEVDDGLELHHGELVLATARPDRLDLKIPAAPDYMQALEASRHFVAFGRHAFPRCFVCGDERERGDGLRIFAGSVAGSEMVAAPWVPDASLATSDGKIDPAFMWAALDCPGYFAARSDGVPMLLGEFAAHADRRVHVDEPCVLLGWRIAVNGRKYEVGTALFDEDGELCGRARATWIAPANSVSAG
jgi:hypothetical protein